MTCVFNNLSIIKKLEERKTQTPDKVLSELKKILPLVSDETLISIYIRSVSLHQSFKQKSGAFLETELAQYLNYCQIPFRQQVCIDANGMMIGFGNRKTNSTHIIDFVIGENILLGESIINYAVISCKTTCRERWTQDDWTFTFKPKKYILLTTSNDYPSSSKFRESLNRKIITCCSKKRDDREYKLNFQDLINEINFY